MAGGDDTGDDPAEPSSDEPAEPAEPTGPAEPPESGDEPAIGPEVRRRRVRRTNTQRTVIVAAALSAVLSLTSAAVLAGGQYLIGRRRVVDIKDPSEQFVAGGTTTTSLTPPATPPTDATSPNGSTGGSAATEPPPNTTRATTKPTFPEADPAAKNFLITGADNNSCIDPDSPLAATLGEREGERSDTIVIWRVDPTAKRAAVLSLPRDLWVTIPDAGQSRINSAYRRDDPQLLINTIYANFGIPINHFVQLDFCAFKTIVNTVGGIAVPFEFPTRDEQSGLNVPTAGCFEFDGDTALAYVRSRHYEYLPPGADPVSGWEDDYSSDLGRVSRQQDFMRRMLAKVSSQGRFNPRNARGLIQATTENLVTDDELSPQKLLEFAGVLRKVQPDSITNYQIISMAAVISGSSVLLPQLDSEEMQEVLALFRGQLSLAELPTTSAPPPSTTVPAPPPTTPPAGWSDPARSPAPPTTTPAATPTTVDDGTPEDIEFGIVPPAGIVCD